LLPALAARASAERWRRVDGTLAALEAERFLPDAPTRAALGALGIAFEAPATTADLLRRPELDSEHLRGFSPALQALDARDRRVVAETLKYAGYVERQRREADRLARAGSRAIPSVFEYRGLAGLSNELVEKLEQVRPETLGRASRIDGMTPAALALLAVHLERLPAAGAA
jgi:tRNA uridine 5-carboxymethylaminomethyl modification enzyme